MSKSNFQPLGLLILMLIPFFSHAEDEIKKNEIKKLKDIVITATPFDASLFDYSKAVSILDKEEIQKKGEFSLGETISLEPGVSSTYFGPASSRPVIRGNAGERVRILQNGLSTLDVSSVSEDHMVTVNPISAERIEILRGSETLLYGSSAIGGVVNLSNNSIPEVSINRDLKGVLDLQSQTADNSKSASVLLEGQAGELNWHFDAFNHDASNTQIPVSGESTMLLEAEGEEIPDNQNSTNTLDNSFANIKGYSAGFSLISDTGFDGFSYDYYSSRYGVPGHSHHEDMSDEHDILIGEEVEEKDAHHGVRIDLEQYRLNFKGKKEISNRIFSDLKYKLSYSDYQHKEIEDEVGSVYLNRGFDSRLEFVQKEKSNLDGILGLQFQRGVLETQGEEALVPKTTSLLPAIFIYEELKIDEQFKIDFGARQEYVNYSVESLDEKSFSPSSFSSGIYFNPNGEDDYLIGISFAHSKRAPSAIELFSDGFHAARQIYEIGDKDLKLEASNGIELTLKKNVGLITGDLNLFYQNYNNYINLDSTTSGVNGLPTFKYSQIEANFYGFEFDSSLHLHELMSLYVHDIDLNFQVDYVRAKDDDTNQSLPRIPPLRTILGFDYSYKNDFNTGFDLIFVSEQNKTANYEIPTDSYTQVNMTSSYVFYRSPLDKENFEIFFRGINLSNQEARIHSSFLKDLAPLRARSFIFGLRASF